MNDSFLFGQEKCICILQPQGLCAFPLFRYFNVLYLALSILVQFCNVFFLILKNTSNISMGVRNGIGLPNN